MSLFMRITVTARIIHKAFGADNRGAEEATIDALRAARAALRRGGPLASDLPADERARRRAHEPAGLGKRIGVEDHQPPPGGVGGRPVDAAREAQIDRKRPCRC